MTRAMSTWLRACAMLAVPAMVLAAQAPPQQGQSPPAPAPQAQAAARELQDLWIVIYNVRPASTDDFEAVATRVRDALRESTDPYRRQQAAGLRIHKSALPSPEGNAMYFVQVPTQTGNEADRTGLDVLIDAVLPAEATALKQRLEAALDPRNPSGHTLMLAIR